MDIVMPKMGESVMEGTIIKWYKKVGDRVKKDEPCLKLVPIKWILKSLPLMKVILQK